jgi:N-acyl-D-aspartate/D-glutamate deacylase
MDLSAGRIEAIGNAAGCGVSGARTVDASGLAVAPGFFDFHSHADFTIPNYPDAINSISQGVTTEVMGNCGFSPAPLSIDPPYAEAYKTSCRAIGPDLDWRWSSFAEYLDVLGAVNPPVNCAPLVGHNALRSAVMGFEDRPPTFDDLAAMQGLVDAAMEAGAWGMSSGLIYAPGTYSHVDELVALASTVAARGGIYSSHIRNEGSLLVESVEEALEVGRRAGVPVEVSHLKATGVDNYGLVQEAFAALDRARADGVDAYCDVYPYTAGSTFLAMLTPGWAQEGGFGELVKRLRSSEIRSRLRREMVDGLPGWNSMLGAVGNWDGIVISGVARGSLKHYEGQSIAALSAREGKDPFEFAFDLLVADDAGTLMVVFLMDEQDVNAVLQYPWSVIGSDQLLVTGRERKTHPRAYGSYVKVLGPLVRDRGLFPLETAVHKMTGLPAEILGMTERGRLVPGAIADIVLFDPVRVGDTADYANPARLATGIELVLMGGEVAYRPDGVDRPGLGKVLRRGA